MKAIAIDHFNTDPTAHDLPVPEPGDDEVLVDVAASSLNGMDIAIWSGMIQGTMEHELPITLGRDFAGTVIAVGSGVTGLRVGDAVFGVLFKAFLHDGTLAEQVAVPAANVAKRPSVLDLASAGAIGLAGTAAKMAIDAIAPHSGETVLVAGATGGVGSIAVQLAKARRATVIATATAAEAEFVRGLGADEIVDYTGDIVAPVRQLHPNGIEGVVHTAGDGLALADVLVHGGRFASTLGLGPDQFAGREVRATSVLASPSTEILDQLAAAVLAGRVRVPITKTYTLDEIPRAIADFTAGTLGKLAVTVAPDVGGGVDREARFAR